MFRAQDSISDGDMIAQAFKALSLGVIVGTTTYGGLAETACEYEFVDGGSCCIAGIPIALPSSVV
jgi:C-terminal processing protease CtpA/Prc